MDMPLQTEPMLLPGRPFGRVVRSVAGYALLTALAFRPPMIVFLPAVLFHCDARNGRRAAWTSLLIGALIVIGIAAAMASMPGASAAETRSTIAALAGELLAIALPAMLVLPLIARDEPFGRVLTTAIIAACAGLVVTELASRAVLDFSPYADMVKTFRDFTAQLFTMAQQQGGSTNDLAAKRRWFDLMNTFCVPALVLINIVTTFVLSILMFGRLRAWHYTVARREAAPGTYLFRNLSLPEWLLFAFVAGGLAPLLSGVWQHVAANVLALVTFLYLLQGLAILRWLLATMGTGILGTMLIGSMAVLFLGPLMSLAGLFDSFFDFRKFKRKDHSDESHSD
jgi:Predicted membrane protein (DUF2232)